MNRDLHADDARLVRLLDLTEGEIWVQLDPLPLRVRIHEIFNVCLVVANGIISFEQVDKEFSNIVDILVARLEGLLVEAMTPSVVVSL